MIDGVGGTGAIGPFEVVTTSNGGLPPEHYAERICAKLMYVAEGAPQPIRDQAIAYQDRMRQVLLAGIKQAILSNHTTVIYRLKQAGMHEAAQLVFEMRN